MHMITHEAISNDRHSVFARVLLQQIQVLEAINVSTKDILPAIASLGDVVSDVGNHRSCDSRHTSSIP